MQRAFPGVPESVSWEDQQQWSTTQSAVQGPTMSGLLHNRTNSSKSLHQVVVVAGNSTSILPNIKV